MAASTRRMNGKVMAGVLLLCTLLLTNEVTCQDDAVTDAPTADPAADNSAVTPDATDSDAAAGATVAPGVDASPTAAPGGEAATPADGNTPPPLTILPNADDQEGGTSGTTAAPSVLGNEDVAAAEVQDHTIQIIKTVVPDVMCVGKADVAESNAVKAVVDTVDCEATKRIIQENAAGWCHRDNCNLKIFQEGNNILVASDDAKLGTLAEALQSENLKEKLGVTKTQAPSTSGSSVFVGILVTGLLAAVAITLGYFKCQRRSDTKDVKLAEEGYPVDQENQGNTLVSVAPLNPPAETEEKPSINGESPEAAKTEPPPTNGTSATTKTADTEL